MADENKNPMLPPAWIEKTRQVDYTCRVFDVCKVEFEHPARNMTGTFYAIDASDWVLVIALTPEKEVLLVNQFRFGSESNSWEMPGGIIERGEDTLEAGLRELREETGYEGEKARLITFCSPNPAIMTNACSYVIVENIRKVTDTQWDAHEEIAMKTVSIEEAFRMAKEGEIHHALVLVGLLYLQMELPEVLLD